MKHDRDSRDASGVGPYAQEREHLVPMSALNKWSVTDGEPDIRGWEVRTVSGRQLGNVADLLVDRAAGEVVLLDVDLPASDRHTFVPIRVVQIDRAKRMILMDSADLPDTEVAPADAEVADHRVTEAGTVRYPRTDREVELGRLAQPDDVARNSSAQTAEERRRGERRRIERVSTDL